MDELFVWQKNLRQVVRTRDVVILHGNIRDLYIYRDSPHHHEVLFEEMVVRLLWQSCGVIRRFDPYYKTAELSLGEGNAFIATQLEDFGTPGFNNTVDPTIARIFSDLVNKTGRRTWLLKQMHNLLPYRSSYSQEECLRLVAFQNMIEHIAPGNKLIVCYLSDTQVPIELAQQSHRIGFVNIPLPDFEERKAFWSRLIDGVDLSEDLAKLTDGMALTSLRRLVELGQNRVAEDGNIRSLSLRDWERVISQYKFGETPDYYQQITIEQLNNAYEIFTHKEGVQGQDYAIGESIKMLWKARANVSPLLRTGPSSAPRGNLFFCGPSGTGKTMLAKKIAKFVFGSEEAFCRIDMSEYQQDFTVSKLIGAPPGYVGYEAGGILTNAMIEKPFSVVLFDEIEKAHPRVFDLFLQILSDGRLTDSRGQTVFFSQAIIIFTSNIGTRAAEAQQLAEAQQSDDPDRVREHFLSCVRRFFRHEISRPELLNRIGNNIVPFSFLEGEDVLVKAVLFYLDLLKLRFEQEYSERRLSLKVDRETVARFIVQKYNSDIREFGGRAVINTLDDKLLPELAQQLLELEMTPPSRPTVIRVDVGMRDGHRQICVHV